MTVTEAPKKNKRNKKVAAGIGVAALACAALAIGTGTYAAFSDTKAGPSGTLAAGTLVLTVGGSGTTQLFDDTINPGQVITKQVTVKNDGSVKAKVSATAAITGDENGCTAAETTAGGCTGGGTGPGNLQDSDQLQVSIDGSNYYPVNSITQAQSAVNAANIVLDPGQTQTQTYYFKLNNNDNNNKVQSDKVTITSTFTLTQVTS